MTDQEIYEKFIKYLGDTWWGLPESKELMPIIRERYTVEDAEFLLKISLQNGSGSIFGKSAEKIAKKIKMDVNELQSRLDDLAYRGLIFHYDEKGRRLYTMNESLFVFIRSTYWRGAEDDMTKAMAPRSNRYYLDGFWDQFKDIHIKGLRALPIDETIKSGKLILPFEDVVKVIDEQEVLCVATCPCRHRKNLDPDTPDCKHPTENCLHFGALGKYMIEHGFAREITKEETHEILKEAADSGLVHGLSNWKQGVDTICNCCKCCCMWFEGYHELDHPESMDKSNYILTIDPVNCSACEKCVKRCPVEAISLEDNSEADNAKGKAPSLQVDRCIGCGVCVHKCPTKSLILRRKPEAEITEPPKHIPELAVRITADQMEKKSHILASGLRAVSKISGVVLIGKDE